MFHCTGLSAALLLLAGVTSCRAAGGCDPTDVSTLPLCLQQMITSEINSLTSQIQTADLSNGNDLFNVSLTSLQLQGFSDLVFDSSDVVVLNISTIVLTQSFHWPSVALSCDARGIFTVAFSFFGPPIKIPLELVASPSLALLNGGAQLNATIAITVNPDSSTSMQVVDSSANVQLPRGNDIMVEPNLKDSSNFVAYFANKPVKDGIAATINTGLFNDTISSIEHDLETVLLGLLQTGIGSMGLR